MIFDKRTKLSVKAHTDVEIDYPAWLVALIVLTVFGFIGYLFHLFFNMFK